MDGEGQLRMAEGMRGVRPWHGHCYNYRNYNDMHVFHASLTPSARICWKALGLVAAGLLTIVPHQANGATINARSPAFIDVATAISLAKDGDTVVVPAGSASWTALTRRCMMWSSRSPPTASRLSSAHPAAENPRSCAS